jgi:hypothetical protein
VQRRRGRRLPPDLDPQGVAPRLQFVELPLQVRRLQPVSDCIDEVRELALHRAQFLLPPGARAADLGAALVPCRDERGAEPPDQFGMHQPGGQRLEHLRLEPGSADPPRIVAALAVPRRGASEVVLPERGEGPAAATADDLLAEQVPWPAAFPERRSGFRRNRRCLGREARLCPLPHLLLDNTKLGHAGFDDVPGVRHAQHLAAGDRLAELLVTTPDQPADVERVPQDAVAALRPAADRGVVPGNAVRARDALRVQLPGDRARAVAGAIRLEDPPHDVCGDRVGLAQAAFRLAVRAEAADHAIAVGRPPEAPSHPDTCRFPAPRVLSDIDEDLGVEDPLHAELERVDLAFGDRVHLHAQEARLLVEGSDMLEVARKAILAPGKNDIDVAGLHGCQQGLVTLAQGGGAGDRGVGEGPDDGPALPLGIGQAMVHLVRDGSGVLQFRTEARVDGGAQGHRPALRRPRGA